MNFKKRSICNVSLFLLVCMSATGDAAAEKTIGQCPGIPYPATDRLGRSLPLHEEVGDIRPGKTVAMFYWTWHVHHSNQNGVDLSKLINAHPEMEKDWNHPLWATYSKDKEKDSTSYFWSEPLFDFYDGRDKWVIRKQLEMLGDAGVDLLFYDCSNAALTFKEGYVAVAEAMAQARADGVNVPQFAFILNLHSGQQSTAVVIEELYDEMYSTGKFRESWFMWKGKPVIMAYPEPLNNYLKNNPAKLQAIKAFFTFRPGQGGYATGPTRPDQWAWLEVHPQHGFGLQESGKFEFATVGVAQNWSGNRLAPMSGGKSVTGRSYTSKHKFDKLTSDSYLQGYNFLEQWDRAIELDPDIVFITGWNEWRARRHKSIWGYKNAFPDQFDAEYSRDIEPDKGAIGDNYYYQMIANIRRFKGMLPPEAVSPPTAIHIDGDFADWSEVTPRFKASRGNVQNRDGYGYLDQQGKPFHYTNTTARNDIIGARVARDSQYIYFYVESAKPFTPSSDPHWMQLFIDLDRDKRTGWEGYELMLDRYGADGKVLLSWSVKDFRWNTVGTAEYRVAGSKMEIAIPKVQLKLAADDRIDFEFKWIDSPVSSGNIMDVYTNGEAAPSGRFNYHYKTR